MDSIVGFSNFTTLSILNLVLTYQSYRIAYIYASNSTSEITSKIAESTWDHMVPVYHINLEKIYPRRFKEEPTLNVFVVNNSSDIHGITRVKDYLEPKDVTVILLNSPNSNMDGTKFQPWMTLSLKVLIVWKTFLISVNQFGSSETGTISIHPYNRKAAKHFIEEYLMDIKDANGAKMTIFMRHVPPKSTVGPMLRVDNYTFNGPDGVLSDLLVKALNISPTYVTDIEILFPFFNTWKKVPGIAARLHYYGYHKEATTSNLISKFNVTGNSTMDFYMSPHLVDEDDMRAEFNSNSERLYPHEKDCLLVFVPKQLKVQNFLKEVIRNGEIQSICCVLLVFVIARIVIQRAGFNEWFTILFKTFQFFLIQGKMPNRSGVEAAWTVIFRCFSVMAISTISAILFKSLVNVQPRQIDTVADLIDSNMTVFIPESISSQFFDDFNTKLELRKAVVELPDEKFGSEFFSRGSNAAFICREEYGQFLMKMKNTIMIGTAQSHVMKEKLHCRLNSYRINKSSPFIRRANDFLLRCLDNGLYYKVHTWAVRLSDALFTSYDENPKPYETVIELRVILSVFIWYLGETLGNNEELRLAMVGPAFLFLCGTQERTIVHLKDNAQRTLLIFTLIPGQIGRDGIHARTDSMVRVENTSGQTVLVARGEESMIFDNHYHGSSISSLTVWSSGFEQYLGRLGGSICCFTCLKAVDSNNEVLFHINDSGICCCSICCDTSSKFYLISGGVTLAQVRKSNDQVEISLLNARDIDSRTKAFLVFAGYYLFILYFADTSCGRIGTRGMFKRVLCFQFFLLIVSLSIGLCFIYLM